MDCVDCMVDVVFCRLASLKYVVAAKYPTTFANNRAIKMSVFRFTFFAITSTNVQKLCRYLLDTQTLTKVSMHVKIFGYNRRF